MNSAVATIGASHVQSDSLTNLLGTLVVQTRVPDPYSSFGI